EHSCRDRSRFHGPSSTPTDGSVHVVDRDGVVGFGHQSLKRRNGHGRSDDLVMAGLCLHEFHPVSGLYTKSSSYRCSDRNLPFGGNGCSGHEITPIEYPYAIVRSLFQKGHVYSPRTHAKTTVTPDWIRRLDP